MIRGVLFDLDGVLYNGEDSLFQCEVSLKEGVVSNGK